MGILGPLSNTANGNQYVIVVTDCYSKLTWAIPSPKTTSTHIANIILDHWIIPHGTPFVLLTDSGTQFVSKFFVTLCGLLGGK